MLRRALLIAAGGPLAALVARLLASVVHVSVMEGGSGVPFFLTVALALSALVLLAVGAIMTALALFRAYRAGKLTFPMALYAVATVVVCVWLTRFISTYPRSGV